MDHPDFNRRALLRGTAALPLLAAGLASSSARAEDAWPTKPVRIVIAVGPGSSGDTLARMIAPRLEAIWKQPVIVENRPGAGGIIGTEYVIAAKDGHTLLLASQSSYLPKFTQKNVRYDPLTDLVPIYRMINWEMAIVTNGDTAKRAKTFPDLVKLSDSGDKGLFFAGTGNTSIFNITMALVNKSFGMKYSSVDFNSVGAMNMAVLRNDAQVMINTPSSVRSNFESGGFVPLAVVNHERYPDLPNVPAVTELPGFHGYLPIVWAGMVGPAGLPQPVVDRIAHDLRFVLNNPDIRKSIETQLSGVVQDSSPAAFSKQIREETVEWKRLFAEMKFEPQ